MIGRYLTISIDDGCSEDGRTAELLQQFGLPATFYVPARNAERPVLTPNQIRDLGQHFEIGGHTFNHVALKSLPPDKCATEIRDGKQYLEQIVGRPVISFCYPRGKFNSQVAGLVKQAGFLGARTLLFNLPGFPEDPFLWGVSTHACRHSAFNQVQHALLERNFKGIWNYFGLYKAASDWQTHFMHALDYVEAHGGVAHLYLHSWEIEKHGEWNKLAAVLRTASSRALTPMTNGALFQLWASASARNGAVEAQRPGSLDPAR